MLDRQGGKIVFECDCCTETLDTETRDFDTALTVLRENQWTYRKEGDVWVHFCPDHSGDGA